MKMTDTMPTRESLDEASRATVYSDWKHITDFHGEGTPLNRAIIAHDRTLDKLHGRTPVDPDVEALSHE